MKVEVLPEDNALGKSCSVDKCPFALAFLRTMPHVEPADIIVVSTNTRLRRNGQPPLFFWHPPELQEAIDAFDEYKTPIPTGEYELVMTHGYAPLIR